MARNIVSIVRLPGAGELGAWSIDHQKYLPLKRKEDQVPKVGEYWEVKPADQCLALAQKVEPVMTFALALELGERFAPTGEYPNIVVNRRVGPDSLSPSECCIPSTLYRVCPRDILEMAAMWAATGVRPETSLKELELPEALCWSHGVIPPEQSCFPVFLVPGWVQGVKQTSEFPGNEISIKTKIGIDTLAKRPEFYGKPTEIYLPVDWGYWFINAPGLKLKDWKRNGSIFIRWEGDFLFVAGPIGTSIQLNFSWKKEAWHRWSGEIQFCRFGIHWSGSRLETSVRC